MMDRVIDWFLMVDERGMFYGTNTKPSVNKPFTDFDQKWLKSAVSLLDPSVVPELVQDLKDGLGPLSPIRRAWLLEQLEENATDAKTD